MTSWRTADYAEDATAALNRFPQDDPIYLGSNFKQQDMFGSPTTDPEDDRVTFMGDAEHPSIQTVSFGLPADTINTGHAAVYGGTSVFGGMTYGDKEDVWYDTLRPNAGFPLPAVADELYAAVTGDTTGHTLHQPDETEITNPEAFQVQEKPKQLPSRGSLHPVELQHERPWDVTMGAWPWTGEKAALQRPVATAPLQFATALVDPMPSPTGTSNAEVRTEGLEPYVLTYRFTPAPWDTGNEGNYVDSGV